MLCRQNKIHSKTNGIFQTKIYETWAIVKQAHILTANQFTPFFYVKKHTTDIFFKTCYILTHKKFPRYPDNAQLQTSTFSSSCESLRSQLDYSSFLFHPTKDGTKWNIIEILVKINYSKSGRGSHAVYPHIALSVLLPSTYENGTLPIFLFFSLSLFFLYSVQ